MKTSFTRYAGLVVLVIMVAVWGCGKTVTEESKPGVTEALAGVLIDDDIGPYHYDHSKINVRRLAPTKEYVHSEMSVEYDDANRNEVSIKVFWLKDRGAIDRKLAGFLAQATDMQEREVGGSSVLQLVLGGSEIFMWSDAEHLLIGIEPEVPTFPDEVFKAYLARIPSNRSWLKSVLDDKGR